MKTTERTARLVPALAVSAMSIAALAATLAAWVAGRTPEAAPAPDVRAEAQRPRPDDPVRVVRSPRDAQPRPERML